MDNTIAPEGGRIDARLNEGGPPITTKGTYHDGKWHHVATTIGGEAGTFRLHVNGVAQGQGALTSRRKDSNRLGIDTGPDTGRCQVTMDDIRVYGRALAAGEVEALCRHVPSVPRQATPPAPAGSRR